VQVFIAFYITKLYQSLNPAELKRGIDEKVHLLFKAYEEKNREGEALPSKNKLLDSEQKVAFQMAE